MLGTRSHGRGRQSGLKSPRRAGSWPCPLQRRPGAGPSWLCMTSPTREHTWPGNHTVLYTALRAGVMSQLSAPSSSRSELPQGGFPASAFQALVLLSLPGQAGGAHCKSSHRNQSRGGLGQAGGRSTSIQGETSTSPHNYIKASALGNGEPPTLKTRNVSWKWIMTFCDKRGSHQNNCLSWAEQLCVPGRVKLKVPDTMALWGS